MKIVSTGSTLSSLGFQEKRRLLQRKKLIWGTVIILVLISFIVFLSRRERFLINEIEVIGATVVRVEDVKLVVNDLLSGDYLWLVPHRNALVYPPSTIEEN